VPLAPPIPRRRGRWLGFALFVVVGLAAAWVVGTGAVEIPERFDPWAPLDATAPPDWLTGFKLDRARAEPARCLAALARTGMQYDVLPDRETGPGCGFDNAVRLRSAGVRLSPAPSLSCPMALSFFMWETHALQPAAERHFGRPVVAVEHLGSYACRNINRGKAGEGKNEGRGDGRREGRGATPGASRSRHATANALDVAGLTLSDGRRIGVLQAWRRQANTGAGGIDDPAALLLRDAHQGACRFFDGVLGPDYNAVHRDHFHLETGGYSLCR
jgi:hypothetical protein